MEMEELKQIVDQKIATEESKEKQDDECEEESPLKADEDQSKHSLNCSVDLVKKLITLTILWIAYFLGSVAFSTIAPFFPKVVSHQCILQLANYITSLTTISCIMW